MLETTEMLFQTLKDHAMFISGEAGTGYRELLM